jgi:hypothetical protein
MACSTCRRELLDGLKDCSRSEALELVQGLSQDLTQFEYLASHFPFPLSLSRANWG